MSNYTTAMSPTTVPSTYFKVNGAVALTEFTVGASLNLACFTYFLRRSQSVGTSAVNSLFLAISFVDICICLNMLFSAISALNDGAAMCFSSKFLCNMWGLVWHTGQGLSIFLVALLAFARWRCMTQPLKTIKRETVIIAILVYAVFQIFKSTLNYWYIKEGYKYDQKFLGCTISNINTRRLATVDKVAYFFLYICEILVPAIPIIAFSIATMVCLRKSSRSLSALVQDKMVWTRKRDAAVTMLILVGAYIFFNVCYWCLLIGDALYIFSEGEIKYHHIDIWGSRKDNKANMKTNMTYYMTYYAIYIHSVVFNSTVNAVIYIIRLGGLRASLKELLVGLVRKVKRVCPVKREEYNRVNSFTLFDQIQRQSPLQSQMTLCTKASGESQIVG